MTDSDPQPRAAGVSKRINADGMGMDNAESDCRYRVECAVDVVLLSDHRGCAGWPMTDKTDAELASHLAKLSSWQAEQQSGIEKLRRMRELFANCNETFNQQWSVPQLEKIYDAYHACGHDITPDCWTMDQVLAALRGGIPSFEQER